MKDIRNRFLSVFKRDEANILDGQRSRLNIPGEPIRPQQKRKSRLKPLS